LFVKIAITVVGLLPVYILAACGVTTQMEPANYVAEPAAYAIAELSFDDIVAEHIAYEAAEILPILRLVAHAGAAVEGFPDSNSLEALRNAATLGFRYIEVDLIQTSDGYTVGNHNWYNIGNRIPGVRNEMMTHAEFMAHRIFGRFTPLDLDMLVGFLRQTPDVFIITDTKDTDYAALYEIAYRFPEYQNRFITQSYTLEDVPRLRDLGFENIMLTIYAMHYSEQNPVELHQFALENKLYALVIPDALATPQFVAGIGMNALRIFVHTIDNLNRAQTLAELGFYGIYTAHIAYDVYNDNGISRRNTPVQAEVSRISQNMRALEHEQHHLISTAIFYQLNNTVYIHGGEVLPIWDMHLVTHPFVSPVNGRTYVTRLNFDRYSQGHVWSSGQLDITAHELSHRLHATDYDVFIYRDMMFVCAEKIADIFNFELHQHNNLIIFAPPGSDFDELKIIGEITFR